MMKTLLGLLMLTTGLAAFAACDDDSVKPPQKFIPEPGDLTQKWHVLNNMELAYNQRRLDKYDELLDNSFSFFLSSGDVGGGLPASWDREVEVHVHTYLFMQDPPPPAPIPRCKSIRMDIKWEDDNGNPALTWIEVSPPGSTETWYMATVYYDFQIEIEPDMTFINNRGARAQFTVRNAGTDEMPQWRLVEMRDLSAASSLFVAGSARATEPNTWGKVKAMYR